MAEMELTMETCDDCKYCAFDGKRCVYYHADLEVRDGKSLRCGRCLLRGHPGLASRSPIPAEVLRTFARMFGRGAETGGCPSCRSGSCGMPPARPKKSKV